MENVEVDVTRKIRKVSMFIDPKGRGYLNRLKMLDDHGEPVVDLTFWSDETGFWYTHEIPFDKEIIGLFCNIGKEPQLILRLGFLLWTPPPMSKVSQQPQQMP